MEIPELRKEFSTQCISDLIETVLNKKTVSLWQNLDQKRDCVKAKLVKFNCVEKKLKFYPMDLKYHFNFKSDQPIFFYESGKSLIFKTSICYQSSFELEVWMPEEVMVKDYRANPRTLLFEEENVVFDLNAERGREQFCKQLVDVSEQGISFMNSSREHPLFYEGDTIQFKKELCDIDIPFDEAKIIYTTIAYHPRFPTKKYVRVGVQFMN